MLGFISRLFILWGLYVVFILSVLYFDDYSFIVQLEIGKCVIPAFFFLRISSAIQSLVWFCVNVKSVFCVGRLGYAVLRVHWFSSLVREPEGYIQ